MTTPHTVKFFMKRPRDTVPLDPARSWLSIFSLSTLAFIAIVLWNVWAFNTAARGGVIGAPPIAAQPLFDRSSLDAIRSVFASRAEEEAKYVTGVYRYTDPSQP